MNLLQPLVIFTPAGKRGRFPKGTTVLQAARALGCDLDTVCGGRGICSRCQVAPAFGKFPKHGISSTNQSLSAWNEVEEKYHLRRGLKLGRRLGCQAQIVGDVVIDIPVESQLHQQIVRKSLDERPIVMNSAVRLHYIEVPEPDMEQPIADLERFTMPLEQEWNITNLRVELSLLRSLQDLLCKGDGTATVAVHRDHKNEENRLIGLWSGYFDAGIYGLAVDLGSTTIAAHLCRLTDGKVVASSGIMNPQIRFGEDLMSRVSYAMLNKGGHAEMTHAVLTSLDELFLSLAGEAEIAINQILELVIVSNPIMHHLLLGLDPSPLGVAPFVSAVTDSIVCNSGDLQLTALGPTSRVYLLPTIAGHVGADCASVILAEQPHQSDEKTLLIDVGTNAEIVFGDKTRILACSSPTGPAFEGAQISSGQRAAPGAIERVRIDPATKRARFKVVGCELWSDEEGFETTAKVTGICGSGIIEAVAEMRMSGLVDGSGLIGSPQQTGCSQIIEDGRVYTYQLCTAKNPNEDHISITQLDIRAVQLAKSALYAGARLLMDEYGTESVDRIVLTGAFGSHISPLHAMVLGMIPDCPLACVTSVSNAASTGARIALCSVAARQEIEQVVQRIEKIETAVEPRFQEHFVNANALPHAIDPFPELAKSVRLSQRLFRQSIVKTGRRPTQRKRK